MLFVQCSEGYHHDGDGANAAVVGFALLGLPFVPLLGLRRPACCAVAPAPCFASWATTRKGWQGDALNAQAHAAPT